MSSKPDTSPSRTALVLGLVILVSGSCSLVPALVLDTFNPDTSLVPRLFLTDANGWTPLKTPDGMTALVRDGDFLATIRLKHHGIDLSLGIRVTKDQPRPCILGVLPPRASLAGVEVLRAVSPWVARFPQGHEPALRQLLPADPALAGQLLAIQELWRKRGVR